MPTEFTPEHDKMRDADAQEGPCQSRLRRVVDMTSISQTRGKKSKDSQTHHEVPKSGPKHGKKNKHKDHQKPKRKDADVTTGTAPNQRQAQAHGQANAEKDTRTQNAANKARKPENSPNKAEARQNQTAPKARQSENRRPNPELKERRLEDKPQAYSPRTVSPQKMVNALGDDKTRTLKEHSDEKQTSETGQNQPQTRRLASVPKAKKQKFAQSKTICAKKQSKIQLSNEARGRAAIERHSSGLRTTRKVQRASLKSDVPVRKFIPAQNSTKIIDALLLQSWRAKEWVKSIADILDTAEQIDKSILLVQAKLISKLEITLGRASAEVVNRNVSVDLRQFTLGQWRSVISMLSDRAIYTTSLLNGELPAGIIDVFKQGSVSLFPQRARDFSYKCDCPQKNSPCEHACAVLLSIAQALEEDPFKLLLLRGITREDLLAQLRDARSDQVVDEKTRNRISFEIPAQNLDFNAFYAPKGDFDAFTFHIAYAKTSLLKRLGNPAPWEGRISVQNCVGEVMDLAAKRAEIIGLCEKAPEDCQEEITKNTSNSLSRAPKNSSKVQYEMPDLDFILHCIPENIREAMTGDPIQIAEDILCWLKKSGPTDMRTLARRTRLHKPTIQAFLQAFCEKKLVRQESNDEHGKYVATF